jgi:hypothetical protein
MSKTKDYCIGGWMVNRTSSTNIKWRVHKVFWISSQQASPLCRWCQCDCWRPCVGTVTCCFWKIRNGLMTGICLDDFDSFHLPCYSSTVKKSLVYLMDNGDAFLKVVFKQLFLNGQEVTLVPRGLNRCELYQQMGRWVLWFGCSEQFWKS